MPLTIAITGGIGSGKSHLCRFLEAQGALLFYADPEAKRIVREHPEVRGELTALVGPNLYDAEGKLVKSVLAAYLCRGKNFSRQVDRIVHPRVIEAWRKFVADHSEAERIYMECALLYESGLEREVDQVILVACPLEERIRRVMQRDGIDRETVLRWMALQLPEEEKARRADHIVLNDGQADVGAQLRALGWIV